MHNSFAAQDMLVWYEFVYAKTPPGLREVNADIVPWNLTYPKLGRSGREWSMQA